MKKYQAKLWSSENGSWTHCFDSLLAAKQWCGKHHSEISADRAYILTCTPPLIQQCGIHGYYDCVSEKKYEGLDQRWKDNPKKVCPKCGIIFMEHPAISRVDGSEICPNCGIQEALGAFLKNKKEVAA